MSKKHKNQGGAEKPAVINPTDNSPHVHQRSKLKVELNIRELKWTDKQKEFIDIALSKDTKIMFVDGPAGTAKTLMAAYCALKILNEKKASDIVYLRSAVENSEAGLGFLPGTVEEKLAVYNIPFWDKMDELLPRVQVDLLKKEERIHAVPINYIRGLNWNAKVIILDESQNTTQKEIVTTLTRLGEFSHLFILADPAQTDINERSSGGFWRLSQIFSDEESKENGVRSFRFGEDDIMRSSLVKFLVKKMNRELE